MTNVPASIRIRQPTLADVPALASVHLTTWKKTYRGICTDAFLDSLTEATFDGYHRPRFDERGLRDPKQPFVVACDATSNELLGFALGGKTRATTPMGDPLPPGFASQYSGELYAIYVDPAQQGRGIGKELLRAFVDRLIELNHASMCLWVFTENRPARAFYERMGGALAGESEITLDRVKYPQVAYAWNALKALEPA